MLVECHLFNTRPMQKRIKFARGHCTRLAAMVSETNSKASGDRMFRQSVLAASIFALLTVQAEGAVLQLEGMASVNSGRGFTLATNNMQLNPGDRVRAAQGCALIVYQTGYQSKVCNGQMAVVVAEPPSPAIAGSPKDTGFVGAPQFDFLPGLLLAGMGIGVACGVACGNHGNQVSP